jgi:hypothetical protein
VPIAIAPVADRLSPRSKNQGNAERRSVTQSPTAGPKLMDWSVLGLKLPGHMKSVKLRLASHGALTVMPLPTEGSPQRRVRRPAGWRCDRSVVTPRRDRDGTLAMHR